MQASLKREQAKPCGGGRQAPDLTVGGPGPMLAAMGSASAVLGSIVFFFLAPGVVAFLMPVLVAQWPVAPMWRGVAVANWVAIHITGAGLIVLVDSFARFALQGRGTPAPVAPTQALVVTGLYRHVRNPMYVAVLAIIIGQGVWFASWPVLLYGLLIWAAFSAFVIGYEEPKLRATYGEQYRAYCAGVRRWWPSLAPWSPPV